MSGQQVPHSRGGAEAMVLSLSLSLSPPLSPSLSLPLSPSPSLSLSATIHTDGCVVYQVSKSHIPEVELKRRFPQIHGFHFVSSYTGHVSHSHASLVCYISMGSLVSMSVCIYLYMCRCMCLCADMYMCIYMIVSCMFIRAHIAFVCTL